MSIALDPSLVSELAARVSGPVFGPDDSGYDDGSERPQRADRPPAGGDRTVPAAGDVVAALDLARRVGLEVSVRGGGHNVAGRAVTDGGVMIDLAEMKRIEVDPVAATATAGGGVTWGELNDAAAEHGLAVTGGAISTTGIAGLHPRGRPRLADGQARAGVGQSARRRARHGGRRGARRQRGLAPGPLLGAQGRRRELRRRDLVHVSDAPLQMVVGGLIAHPIDAAPELLRFYRDAVATAPTTSRSGPGSSMRRTAPASSLQPWSSFIPVTRRWPSANSSRSRRGARR